MDLLGRVYPHKQVLREKCKVVDIIPACAMDDFTEANLTKVPKWSRMSDIYEYQCHLAALRLLPDHAFFYLLAATDIYRIVQKAPMLLSLPSMFPVEIHGSHTQIIPPFKMDFEWHPNRSSMAQALYDYLLIRENTGFSYYLVREDNNIQVLVTMYGSWRYPSDQTIAYADSCHILAEGSDAEDIRTIFMKSYPKIDFESPHTVAVTSPNFFAERRIMANVRNVH